MSQQIANLSSQPPVDLDGRVVSANAYGKGEEGGLFAFDLRTILAAVRRNLVPLAVIIATFLGLGLLFLLLSVPQYVATSRVLVEQEAEEIIEGSSTVNTSYQDADRYLRTQVDILRSLSLAQRVVESQGLAQDAAFFAAVGMEYPVESEIDTSVLGPEGIDGLRSRLAIEAIQGNMSVSLPMDSRLIAISFESADNVLSANIANAIARNYVDANLARKFDSSAYARQFLAQQLADARDKVEESERNLNQYSRQAGLIRVTGQSENGERETTLSVANETLQQLNAAASSATAARIAAEDRWQTIANRPATSVPQVLQNSAVQNLLVQRASVEAKLAEERSRHLDEHPNVQSLEAQLARLNGQIEEVGASIKRSVQLDYQAALDAEQSLTARVEALRAQALNEQDRGVQFNLLRRVAETDRALYNTLLTRFNELSATAGAASNNVSVVDLAEPPMAPSSPNIPLTILVSLLLGLGAGGAFVLMREIFDDALRTPDEVERRLGLPLLGLVPRMADEDLKEGLEDPKSSISEAYQSLVTNIRYSTAGGIPRSLVVTSSQASEGKTTTSQTLAREFAKLGHRTLLIDADMRRPTLHKILPNREQEGFTAVLAGEKTLSEVVVASDVDNLSYMSALPIPAAPSALLASADLQKLMNELSREYDTVIFDSPPVLGLSDAPAISAQMDAVLMVVDATKARSKSAKSAYRRLEMVNAPVIGAILTKFEANKAGGEYDYYNSDYYTYGDDAAK